MSGDSDNTAIWEDADVFVSFNLEAEIPADIDADFSVDWENVGLLDGEAGMTNARTEDVTDFSSWGGIAFRTGRRNFKQTVSFTAWERNDTTDRLENPGSTASEIKVPRPEEVLIAFQLVDGDKKRRMISRYKAEVVRTGDTTVTDASPEQIPFTATIYPDPDTKVIFDRQSTEELTDGS